LFDQPFLLWLIEIHHDVPAKDDVVLLRQEFRLQIVKVEMNNFLDALLDGIPLSDFVEVAEAIAVIYRGHLMFVVDGFLSGPKNRVIDIAGRDFIFPRRRKELVSLTVRFSSRRASSSLPSALISRR